jgi:hypothetical protein
MRNPVGIGLCSWIVTIFLTLRFYGIFAASSVSRIAREVFPGKVALPNMQAGAIQQRNNDSHLWMIAASFSLLVNLCLLAMAGMAVLKFEKVRKLQTPPPPAATEAVAIIHAIPADQTAPAATSERQTFARTSMDQSGTPEEKPAFIGERDTRAASDRTPVADAAPLPSQAGIEPRDKMDIETTESDYQDGELVSDKVSALTPEETVAPSPPIAPAQETNTTAAASSSPPREVLLDGPNPVDVQVPRETADGDEIKATPEKRPAPAENTPPAPAVAEQPKPAASDKPAFRGFQRKTAIVGSISRTGRSSLDVEDSALGRYQAAISRAVELEWQRNCVRHRDFITPGFLTVRFFVETGGKVRSVHFVGEMETGEVQKGFTLNSIRDAAIPPMPSTIRNGYAEEPLELVFRFYF